MAGWTNRGKYLILGTYFQGDTPPSTFYMALCTSGTTPTADINTLSELTQIGTSTGYSDGGLAVARSAVGFDTQTETDASDIAFVQAADLGYLASGGNLGPARWAVLTDDNATVGNRQVIAFFDLGADRTVSDGQTLTLQNCELRLTE